MSTKLTDNFVNRKTSIGALSVSSLRGQIAVITAADDSHHRLKQHQHNNGKVIHNDDEDQVMVTAANDILLPPLPPSPVDTTTSSSMSSPPDYFDCNRIVIESSRRNRDRHLMDNQVVEVESLSSGLKQQRLRLGRERELRQRLPPPQPIKPVRLHHSDSVDGMVAVLSALYCKILVVIGVCLPMAEVISHRIPIGYYEGFYLYLYMGSILFLVFVYLFLLHRKQPKHKKPMSWWLWRKLQQLFWRCRCLVWPENKRRRQQQHQPFTAWSECGADTEMMAGGGGSVHKSSLAASATDDVDIDVDSDADDDDEESGQQVQCGSFYLRVGAVAFGIGSMIYSGLEFAQFFELESKEHCYNFLYGFTPGCHVAFTFIQLYFIFMNSRVYIKRHKLIARFGLMHMIATNICVWLHVLIQETKHQIMVIVNPNTTHGVGGLGPDFSIAWEHVDDVVEEISEDYLESIGPSGPLHHHQHQQQQQQQLMSNHQIVRRSLADHSIHMTHGECRRSNVIGDLVRDASQFLFPCTIEYSLICAAILYIMWKGVHDRKSNTNRPHTVTSSGGGGGSSHHHSHQQQDSHSMSTTIVHTIHHRHHYQVDCAKAHKGLFTGIFLLVISIISLILFFVFIKKPQFRHLAVLQAHIIELFIYCINAIACLIAIFQVRHMPYNRHRNAELDNILLIVAQIGLYIFTMFSVIGAQFFTLQQNTRLVLINASACLIQATLQTIFILDASHRYAVTNDQMRRKPGREMVTFLLVCNFAMWSINTLETRRADSNPVQMHFYGFWAWTIITHVTMPLTIFYRFHSTVCLCDIWKRTYKMKNEFHL
ncbi:proton channel OtopLc-like [Oppia nitens]|uniref:proton channel OtopLc-like n=1 Tax=Oppia nitens TaxID=1686743 RepID=UPI0023D9A6C1|nr:proton channel OtopLc-like [Oppia nitens]